MIDDLPVKVDYAGRIIIPKKVRERLNINKNDNLLLSLENDKIVLKKSSFSISKLLDKLLHLS